MLQHFLYHFLFFFNPPLLGLHIHQLGLTCYFMPAVSEILALLLRPSTQRSYLSCVSWTRGRMPLVLASTHFSPLCNFSFFSVCWVRKGEYLEILRVSEGENNSLLCYLLKKTDGLIDCGSSSAQPGTTSRTTTHPKGLTHVLSGPSPPTHPPFDLLPNCCIERCYFLVVKS